jgi:hypothetical protein
VHRLDPIARLGYDQYARVRDVFTMTRPRWPGDAAVGDPGRERG